VFTVVFLVKKKPSLTQEEFADYWIGRHTPLTAKVPGVRFYRCYPLTAAADSGSPFEGVAVLGFDDEAAWQRAAYSPELAAAIGDAPNFQDTAATRSFYAVERVIV
jgi:uncharacterized protein (TIGR02118 family)